MVNVLTENHWRTQERLRQPGGVEGRYIGWLLEPPAADNSHYRTTNHSTRSLQFQLETTYKMWDDVVEETPAPEAPADVPEAAAAAGAAPAAEAKPEEAEPPPPANVTLGTEPKKLICKHWVRPKFLQYSYLYDYRKNYYDDVINYLDRRNKGLPTERPLAQTWGERALRTYMAKNVGYSKSNKQDSRLLRHISVGARFHRCHTKSLIARKYSKLGFNTVNI